MKRVGIVLTILVILVVIFACEWPHPPGYGPVLTPIVPITPVPEGYTIHLPIAG